MPYVQHVAFNPFTPKSDQSQISPAASPEILHHAVWRIWPFIAYSDQRWLHYQFSLPHPYTSLEKVGRMQPAEYGFQYQIFSSLMWARLNPIWTVLLEADGSTGNSSRDGFPRWVKYLLYAWSQWLVITGVSTKWRPKTQKQRPPFSGHPIFKSRKTCLMQLGGDQSWVKWSESAEGSQFREGVLPVDSKNCLAWE